jgi:thioredoxin
MSVVTCLNCGARNRVDESRAAMLQPKCGRCGTPLGVAAATAPTDIGKPITVTDDTLEEVLRSADEKPVLVDVWAAWCPPCRAIAPTIDQLAAESSGRYVVAKLDADANPRTAARFNVEGIPALLIFKRGQLVEHLVGLQPKQTIAAKLLAHV